MVFDLKFNLINNYFQVFLKFHFYIFHQIIKSRVRGIKEKNAKFKFLLNNIFLFLML